MNEQPENKPTGRIVEIRDDGTMLVEIPAGTTGIIFDGGDSKELTIGHDGGVVTP